MSPPNTPAAAAVDAVLPEVATLEQKLGMLIAHVKVLRATNDNLRRDLAAAEARNQALSERVAEAKRRLDSLVARLPEPTE
jgi:outer membrane murein-binding lipoprotein Lpp